MDVHITLTAELEAMVREKVDAGMYATPADVVTEAVRQMAEREQQVAALRAAVQEGLDSGDAAPWNPDEARSTRPPLTDMHHAVDPSAAAGGPRRAGGVALHRQERHRGRGPVP